MTEGLDMPGQKYSKVILYGPDGKEKKLGDGEIVFVLRAQDELAWQTVEYYADLLAGIPEPEGDAPAVGYQRMAGEVRAVADQMRRYKVKKLPD